MNEQQQSKSITADEIHREKVLVAGYELLSNLNDITFHNSGDSLAFEATQYGLTYMVENLRSIAERAQRIATATLEDLHQAEAGHAWLASIGPKQCANCGRPIDIEIDEWQICRNQAEHTWCHRPDATEQDEDSDRASVIEEAEYEAYCQDRERSGGPVHGDEVALTLPDGRKVEGTWYVPGPAPLSAPIVLLWNGTEVTTAGAKVSVTGLVEDFSEIWVSSLEDLSHVAALAEVRQ